jgi:hypothetical protein
MDSNDEPILTRAELQALHLHFREMKHSINNTFAVIMALSELGQRNPSHLEKLAKSVLDRSPDVVKQLTDFGEMLGSKLKPARTSTAPQASELSGVFPAAE